MNPIRDFDYQVIIDVVASGAVQVYNSTCATGVFLGSKCIEIGQCALAAGQEAVVYSLPYVQGLASKANETWIQLQSSLATLWTMLRKFADSPYGVGSIFTLFLTMGLMMKLSTLTENKTAKVFFQILSVAAAVACIICIHATKHGFGHVPDYM